MIQNLVFDPLVPWWVIWAFAAAVATEGSRA